MEARLAAQAGIDFTPIRAGQMRIRNPVKLARNSVWLVQGMWQARRLMQSWQPQVLFVTGGYACAPVVWAAHRRRVPILIYLPDLTPGLAVQRLARYAARVAVSFPAAAAYFPGKAVVTGYPVRASLRRRPSREQARAHFALAPDLPTLLVFGGSRGARSINIALAAILPELLAAAQVIHITGEFDWPAAQERTKGLDDAGRRRYRAFPYLHEELPQAFAAADLAITRAGAATLGELPAMALPAILIPLPIAGQHQTPNALYLAERGAAQLLPDAAMPTELLPTIHSLLFDPDRLAAMSAASAALAQPDAAERIACAILELAN